MSSRENRDCLDAGSDHIKDTNNKEGSTNGDKHGGLVAPELNISLKNVINGDIGNGKPKSKRIFVF